MRAYGGPRFQVTQQVMSRFARGHRDSRRVDLVPKIVLGGGAGQQNGGTGSVLEALLSLLLSDRLGDLEAKGARADSSSHAGVAAGLRAELLGKIAPKNGAVQ